MLLLTICLETAQPRQFSGIRQAVLTAPTDGNGNWDDTTVSNWLSAGVLATNNSTSASTAKCDYWRECAGIYSITNMPIQSPASTLTFRQRHGYTIYGSQLN